MGTSKIEREIAIETEILCSSVQQIIQKNLGFKIFKRVKVTTLSENVKEKH